MKFALLPSFLLALPVCAQTLVSDQPQNRTVLLEEYTAINCGNCPVGHALAEDLLLAYPGSLTVVAVHGGGLADPGQGQPDLRTSWGASLWSHYGVNSQPRGAINRIPVNSQTVISTSGWTTAVNNALALPSPVNIGVASAFDPGPRTLTVDVELFYTADSPGGSDRITVELKENHIIGYQQDYQNGAHADYDHVHALRACITDLWGDEVNTTDQGALVARSYSFTVPEAWDIANCEVVAIVSEYQGEIYQARSVMADGGFTTDVTDNAARATDVAFPYPVPANERVFIPLSRTEAQATIRVMDNLGREVRTERSSAGLWDLDVHAWPGGVYSFSITSANSVRTGRFIVQR